jgi:hypothetical protein
VEEHKIVPEKPRKIEEWEVLKLFAVIENSYSSFVYDEFKTQLWLDFLKDTPFELAQVNLRRYILNYENRFPPHPGVLAENPVQSCSGNYVPNAQETKIMLDNWDKQLLTDGSSAIPESAMARMRQLGYKSPNKQSR